MNKKLLCAALLAGLGVAQAASAQQFDDRWYVTGSVGYNLQDNERGTRNAPFGAIGLGKFINPNWSIDAEVNYQKPVFDTNRVILNPNANVLGLRPQNLNWSQYGISLDARRHFVREGRNWNPYLLMGLGYQREEIETDNYPSAVSPHREKKGGLAGKFGLGLQGELGRIGVRTELAYRAVAMNDTRAALLIDNDRNDGADWYGDVLASVGVVIPLGPEPVAVVPVAPPPPQPITCADKDSDGDGVNDCNDRCPDSKPGQTIGPDGCPVEIVIDLKGVEFNFDYPRTNWNGKLATAGLVPGSIQTLDNAVSVLQGNAVRVEVAGHTDLCGNDAYNQGLSERRARVVYDYLVSRGIDAGRLMGPNGYGESRPLVNTPQTKPECVNQTNRRTELKVVQ